MNERIVITDGYTLNPGDLSWKPFERFGSISYHDRTKDEEVVRRCSEATIIITNKTPISSNVIEGTRDLKIVAVSATGYNVVDVAAAEKRGVIVCNVPGYGTDSVAQHTFALLLEVTNHVGANAEKVNRGVWSSNPDFCFSVSPIIELSGKTLGIVGPGKIGRKVAQIGEAFGMNIISYSPSNRTKDLRSVSLDELFSTSDVVSLHCPLTNDNAGFVNRELLSRMKPSAILLNTSRGQLINEADLAWALKENVIFAAALDVLSKEPPPDDHLLIGLRNCLVTPHNAWLSVEARQRIMDITYNNILNALKGTPQHTVKP